MLSDFKAEVPEIKETFSEASDALGYDLWALTQSGPAEQLSLTEIAQPLMLTSVSLYIELGVRPTVRPHHTWQATVWVSTQH